MEPNQPNPTPTPDNAPVAPPATPDPAPEPSAPVPPPAGPGATPETPVGAPAASTAVAGESDKEYLTAFLLSYFLGIFGADRFYLGQTGLGIGKLLTLGGCGIWATIDWIMIFAGATKDKEGRPLAGRKENFKLSVIIFLVVLALGVISNIFNLFIFTSS